MELDHSFTVPVGVEEAWRVLLDIERIAPCMPGAAIDSVDGDDFTGTVKVKLGPINLTYKGKASFVEKDETAHRAVIDARGKDTRGNGTAAAKITATLTAQGEGSTTVGVTTDLNITGKPAQFGRGVMVDVGNKLLGQFADCLAGQLAAGDPPAAGSTTAAAASETSASETSEAASPTTAADPTAEPEPVPAPAPAAAPATAAAPPPRRDPEPINLLETAGPAVAKRLAPVVGAVALAAIVIAIARRRRRR